VPALIPELVNAALDPQASVASLLRRSLVAASRLGGAELVDWINSELNGYKALPLPDYRKVRGNLICEREFGGWMPLEVWNADILDMVSLRPIFNSIPELETFASSGQPLVIFFPAQNETWLREQMDPPTRPAVEVQSSQFFGLIEQVRSRILQWALDLESKGVVGEGMSFTTQELQIVAAQHYHFGDVTGSQIQIGSNGSNQSIAQGDSSGALNALISLLRDVIAQNEIAGDVAAELGAELKTLEAQAESPRPKASIIRETALSIQRVLEGVAGNVLATAAPLIHSLVN